MSGPVAWARRHRAVLAVAAVVVALAAAASVLGTRTPGYTAPLDPESVEFDGARAVARVLEDRGVEVDVVRSAADLDDADVGLDTTVVVTSTENLGLGSADRLAGRAARAGALVVADPSPVLTRVLELPLRDEAAPSARRLPSACDDPLLEDLTADRGISPALAVEQAETGTETCFRSGDGPGLVVRVDGEPTTYAIRGEPILGNGRVEAADNAAVALRLLGQRARLVWYVADPLDVEAGDAGSVSAQLPRALGPGLWLLAAATVALLVWRARRLGPLVVEPLPVVVKAIESTQGRGRLYRRTRDRRHAAAVLRAATARRLSAHLRLPGDSGAAALVAALTRLTGRDPTALHDLLVGRAVTDDRSLTALAADLAALEKEVHRP